MQSPEPKAKLPSFLFESYKSYKSDTDRLAPWLGATAESLGYKHADSPASTTTATSTVLDQGDSLSTKPGRLKGKARKAAKEASGSSTTANLITEDPQPPAVTTLLSTSQFVKLAKFIVDFQAPPVTVPPRIITWAARAIQARRLCATWFQSAAINLGPSTQTSTGGNNPAKSATEDRNQTHEYFIEILESVISILATRVGTRSHTANARTKPTVDLVESRFSALSVTEDDIVADSDDDSQDDWDVVDQLVRDTVGAARNDAKGKGGKGMPAKSGPVRHEYRIKDEDQFGFFITYMGFLNNLLEVRIDLMDVWKNVSTTANVFALALTGMATMSLVDAVAAAHKVLLATFPTFMADETQIRQGIFNLSFLVTQDAWDTMMATGVSPLPEYAISDVPKPETVAMKWAEATQLSAQAAIESLMFAMRTGVVEESEIEHRRPVPPTTASTPPTLPRVGAWMLQNEQRLLRDYMFLSRLPMGANMAEGFFPDFLPPPPVLFDLQQLLSDNSVHPAIPSPTLFAAQVYIDIAGHLADDPLQVRKTCETVQKSLKPLISAMILFARHDPDFAKQFPTADLKRAGLLHLVHSAIPWWRPGPAADAGDAFTALHPWWAGMLVGRAQCVLRDLAWNRMAEDTSVFVALYLYFAVDLGMQMCGLIPRSSSSRPTLGWWPLMDQMIEALGMERLFHGREPGTIVDLWKSFMLEMGMSGVDLTLWAAQQSTSNGRKRNLRRSGQFAPFQLRPILMNALSRSARFFLYRYSQEEISQAGLVELFSLIGAGLVVGGTGRSLQPDLSAAQAAGADGANSVGSGHPKKQQPQSSKRKSREQPPTFSSFLSHIQTELDSNAPLALHNTLLLHAQACRLMSYLDSSLFPLLTRIISQDCDPCGVKGEQSGQVFALITAMVDAGGSDAAAIFARTLVIGDSREKWRVLGTILKMIKERVVEMVGEDEAGKFDLSDFVPGEE